MNFVKSASYILLKVRDPKVWFPFFIPLVINNITAISSIIMAMVYVPDDLIFQIMAKGNDKQPFVKEAIEEKLEKEQ